METTYYKILNIPICVKSNSKKVIFSLDKVYTFFKQEKLAKPHLELFIYFKNGDLNDLSNFEIYAVTPSSFDGWKQAFEIWAHVDIIGKYIFELDKAPKNIKVKPGQRLFEIKTRINKPGIEVGWLRQVHLHITLFVFHYLWQYVKNCYIIHGGALAWEKKGIILTGMSGSGKSTLTHALTKAGFRYLTDEWALTDMKNIRLYPFPFSPSFERDSSLLFKEVKNSFDEDVQLNYKNIKCFVDIKKMGVKARIKPIKPEYIIFPTYSPKNKRARIQPISKSLAVKKLSKNLVNFQPNKDQLGPLNLSLENLVKNVTCYKLFTSNLDETIALVKQTLSNGNSEKKG